jgi:hypothetical protein
MTSATAADFQSGFIKPHEVPLRISLGIIPVVRTGRTGKRTGQD